MQARTATVIVDTPADELFDFISQIENVPHWATEFVQGCEVVGPDRARVETPLGPQLMILRPESETGVVDILVGESEDGAAVFPTRVVPLPGGRSVFTFTMLQAPDAPAERFEEEFASLQREMKGLQARFAGDE